jgi:hypothetical protein
MGVRGCEDIKPAQSIWPHALPVSHGKQSAILDRGGKRSATPLCERGLRKRTPQDSPKAPSPLCEYRWSIEYPTPLESAVAAVHPPQYLLRRTGALPAHSKTFLRISESPPNSRRFWTAAGSGAPRRFFKYGLGNRTPHALQKRRRRCALPAQSKNGPPHPGIIRQRLTPFRLRWSFCGFLVQGPI